MGRYHVGDVVMIRDDLEIDRAYSMDDDDFALGVSEEMISEGGRLAKITGIKLQATFRRGNHEYYSIEFDDGRPSMYGWVDEMLEHCSHCEEPPDPESLDILYDWL